MKNATIAVKELEGKVVFLRKLVAGGASRRYGIEVARLAGLPPEVLARARQILANLEKAELDEAGRPQLLASGRREASPAQLGLFAGQGAAGAAYAAGASRSSRALDLDQMTPLAALNAPGRAARSRLGA